MFLADVVDFIIIIFGFWAFGKHSAAADITSSLSDDQVPEAFLVMLLIQFSTMVIDRALYLRKTVLGKLIFQVILVFGIHLWMFFILPAVTERMFSLNTVAQLWYFVKCIYFALSAYQIRCGYPTRILGNFLTKKYNHLNLFLFQGFRLVPFLVELRAVMDWVWTDTTLSLSNWMCVEDIYANIFIIKCSRETEKKYPQPKGQKKKKIVKYGMGGLIILFLICIIWFPLLFMSLVRSVVGVVNHPIDVTVTLQLGGYEPLFTMSAQQQSIQPFTPQDYEALTNQFERQPVAMQFITLYGYEDIVTARIEGSSGSLWSISPPSREQMRRELLNGSSDITLRLTWTFQRDLGKGGTVEHTFDKHTTDLQPGTSVRTELANLLQGTRDTPVKVPHLFPTYIRAPNGPEANPVKQLLPEEEESYLGVKVQLKRERVGTGGSNDSFLEWWVVQLSECQQQACNILPMVIFNDKDHGPLCVHCAGDRQVRAGLFQRDLALHHVRGAALCRSYPQAVPGHLPGARDGRAGAGGGALCQAHLPLPLARDHDQVDAGEGVAGSHPGRSLLLQAPSNPWNVTTEALSQPSQRAPGRALQAIRQPLPLAAWGSELCPAPPVWGRGHLGQAGLVLFKRKFNCFTTSESFKGSWVKTPHPTSVPSSPAAARLLAPLREGGVHSGTQSAAVPACEGEGLTLLQRENPSQPAAVAPNPAAGKTWPTCPLGLLLNAAALTLQSNTFPTPQHSAGQHSWVQAEGPTGLTAPRRCWACCCSCPACRGRGICCCSHCSLCEQTAQRRAGSSACPRTGSSPAPRNSGGEGWARSSRTVGFFKIQMVYLYRSLIKAKPWPVSVTD
ncbi:piezo-type mechanosensitive ion channel component 1-like [Chelonoidis abingdonii]|uniref:piezo-type mechanosensitive ion channel component 1-like n=1 Tax=Chelonoidis abingdonii TaxID=106734 RepID=UPI003F492967